MSKDRGLTFYHKESKFNRNFFRQLLDMIVCTVIAVFLAFVITYVFGAKTSVIGNSMEPGLKASSQILINRMVYVVSAPKVGDVIVFLPNGNTNTHYYVKRVVATPGQTVQIKDGRLYVDGYASEPADEYDLMEDAGLAENPITLDSDEYFVLGDNRNSSEDSRSGNIGLIKKDNIIGKAWIILPEEDINLSFVE